MAKSPYERNSPAGLWREWRRLRDEVRTFRPDVLHAADLVSRHGSERLTRGTLVTKLCLAASVPTGGAARDSHDFVSQQLKARLWWRRDRVFVQSDAVDLERFRPESKAAARARLGWPEHQRIVLLNVGHSPYLKGKDLAEAAVTAARDIVGQVRLVVLDGQVPPEEMPTYLNAADCVLMTSRQAVLKFAPETVAERVVAVYHFMRRR